MNLNKKEYLRSKRQYPRIEIYSDIKEALGILPILLRIMIINSAETKMFD